ncbi:MAG TPA: family 1 glycosylhydrolase [Galbitalea sp.]|nr:family 1 glycosylhydrolase [Galbitalea sp.]
MTNPFTSGSFSWIGGIEDTCVYPPAGSGMMPLDEYELTEHSTHWKSDLAAVRDMGGTSIRYGVNWPLVHTARDEFDWSALDERLAYATSELGLTVIADLVHYGTPTWLTRSFADPEYPDAVAQFAGEFAARYRGIVDHVTPLNEPLTTASFCGLRGVWPPALTGWDGWTTVMLGIVTGISRTIEAVRAANPDAVIVHVEAATLYQTMVTELEDHAIQLASLGMLPTDLLLGRVDASHEMYDWLVENGASAAQLASLRQNVPEIDLLGVNYYPDLSPRTLTHVDGVVSQVATNLGEAGLATSLTRFAERYGLPLLITETSIEGDDAVRSDWLDASVRCVTELRESGMDLRGYTWWPVMDFVDWSYASEGRNVEEFAVDDAIVTARASSSAAQAGVARKTPFLRRMGLIRLEEEDDGSLVRIPTPAAARFRELAIMTPVLEPDA